ncbi:MULTISPECIES: hypothetical protein [Haloarcula]|uniref:hypothetical protein n=1 Tax=Haloarcula TaxID=2237 RepID=UPI0013DE8D4E|nr:MULTISPECIES: hypothetical protein [Haloarcula]NHX40136.1 hypothetical protein [Haloarcula sp. R1-2]
MPIRIDGTEYDIERHELQTLIDRDNPLTDVAQAMMRLDEQPSGSSGENPVAAD